MAKKEQYFWNKKGETFGGCKFGEEVTEKLTGQDKRVETLLKTGKIVTSAPIDFDHAQQDELNALRKETENLQAENKELKEEVKKSGGAKLKEAKEKIVDLEKQIETLTNPGS